MKQSNNDNKDLNILILTTELEKQSIFGIPHKKSYIYYWIDDKNNIGYLYAITEMEALDRLREAFKEVGAIKWIKQNDFNELTNINKTFGICDFCVYLNKNESTCNFLKNELKSYDLNDSNINDAIKYCNAFNSTNNNFCTKGNIDIRTLKINDIVYEFAYGICIKSTVVEEPKEIDKNIWVWKTKLLNGKIIEYSHNIEYPHYSVNLYNLIAYNYVTLIE